MGLIGYVCSCIHVGLDTSPQEIHPPLIPSPTPKKSNTNNTQAYPELLATAAASHVPGTGQDSTTTTLSIDLVTYFDEMHESVFRAATALPFAVRVRVCLFVCTCGGGVAVLFK